MRTLFAIIATLGIVLLVCAQQTESRRHRSGGGPLTFGSLFEPFQKGLKEYQKFMGHQIRESHKGRGWRHGRRSSSSSSSESRESKRSSRRHKKRRDDSDEDSDDDDNDKRSKSNHKVSKKDKAIEESPSQIFHQFAKSHICENSPVYKTFMILYKNALKQSDPNFAENKKGSGLYWMKELADAISENSDSGTCFSTSSCTMRPNNSNNMQPISNQQSNVQQPQSQTPTLSQPPNQANLNAVPSAPETIQSPPQQQMSGNP